MKMGQKIGAVLILVLCITVVLVGGFYYISLVRTGLMEQAISSVMAVTKQHQQAFSNFVSLDRERLHSFAVNFSLDDSTDVGSIQAKLAAFDQVEAVYSVVNLENGVYYINQSNESYQMDDERLAVYREFSGSGVRKPYSALVGMDLFGYYERFTFADGVPALFQKGYESEKISNEFSLSFYDNQGFSFVTTTDGEILLRSVDSINGYVINNVLELIGSDANHQEDQQEFLQAMANRESGTKIFYNKGIEYVYTYIPVEAVDEWYLVSIIPRSAVMDEANQVISNSRIMFFVIMIVIIVLLAAILLTWQVQKRIRAMDQEIISREQQFNILATFLASNTNDVYIMMDKACHKVEFVSPNIERILGVSQQDLTEDIKKLGRAAYLDGETLDYADLSGLKIGEPIGPLDTERVNSKTGEHKWFRETVYAVQVLKSEKIVVYISDRTAERGVQNALQTALQSAQVASKAKSTFLSSMSHDIRTPMNAIIGLLTLLEQDARDPERVLEYVHRMNGASQHLLELINNVLDMNKIESGDITLSIGELSLAEIIDELNTIIRPQAKAKQQDFQIFVSNLTNEHLLGDKTRINQVLINILSNAVKYTPTGGKIEMRVCELPRIVANFSRIQFIIQDNGQGMSEEYQKVMFDPFTREQNTFTNKIQGTGLGMAITKTLVDLMGGTLHVKSKVNEGSTFTVELELRVQETEDDPNFWENHGIGRVIVADDDPAICRDILRIMEGTGVRMDYVTDGETVIQTIRSAREQGDPYDLILLDWKMPKLNGVETARLIRKNYSSKIPILLLTAYDWSDIEQEAMEVGISHFLSKPFFLSNFKEAIRKIVNSRKEAASSAAKVSDVEGKRMLIVEDIEVNRMILTKILTSRGASCDIAVNGQEAVDKFKDSEPGTYDIILMDIQMPVMDGYEATRQIRACSHPNAKTVPIIAMTANAFADDIRAALEAGMNDHVSKPIILDKLEAAIHKVLLGEGQ